jgi:hypothetical protein
LSPNAITTKQRKYKKTAKTPPVIPNEKQKCQHFLKMKLSLHNIMEAAITEGS